MHDNQTANFGFDREVTASTAYSRAMSLLWLDILIICAILAAIASRL